MKRLFAAMLFCCLMFVLSDIVPNLARAEDCRLTISVEDKIYEFYYPEIDYGKNGVYMKGMENVVDNICANHRISPIDAQIVFIPNDENNRFTVIEGTNGKCVDREQLLKEIPKCLNNGMAYIKAEMQELYPLITGYELSNSTYLRSSFSTYFGSSTTERKSNIATAAEKINGTVISDGKIFSFNGTVGARTEENGYKNAKIILDGQFTDGIGGGVCQVSTTLYNAALLSGLEIVEYHPHSLSVSYIEPSFDAMVSEYADLRLKNNTGNNIYIECYIEKDSLYFKMYGVKPKYSYKRISRITETLPAETKIIIDDNNEYFSEGDGYEIILCRQKDGLKSQAILETVYLGKSFYSRTIRKDYYAPVNGLIIRRP